MANHAKDAAQRLLVHRERALSRQLAAAQAALAEAEERVSVADREMRRAPRLGFRVLTGLSCRV